MRIVALSAVLLAIPIAQGCGGDDEENSGSRTTTTATGTATRDESQTTPMGAPTRLEGTYAARLSRRRGREVGPGRWRLRFAGTTAYFAEPDGDRVGAGSPIAVTPTSVTFAPGPICGRQVPGEYRYVLSRGRLQFTLVKDECERRAALLGAGWRGTEPLDEEGSRNGGGGEEREQAAPGGTTTGG